MRKSKMKVYHGVPRSVTDKYTVYYDSFDGKNNTFVNNTDYTFVDSPSGYAIKILDKNHMGYGIPLINNGLENQTIDCWFYSGTKTVDIFNFEDKTTSNDLINRSITLYYTLNDGIRLTNFLPGNSDQPRTITVPNTINIGWVHLRLTIIGNHVSLYVNGNLYHESLTKLRPFSSVWVGLYSGFGTNIDIKIPIISDLHISNIDRGDYFPNLPQDFIDGKAIIKPRMGQQQIKGDPMHSQVIKTKIPGSDWGKNHPYEIIDPDHARLRTNPEIVVSDSLNWNEGNTIEITGLNGEVISGVIDSNTALTRIIKTISQSEYVLNTVEGLSPNDKIRFYISTASSQECTISKVDVINNTITLTEPLTGWEAFPNYYVIETTATSSSPILKTEDGVDVKGTWSGLGTTKATFTLGSNPDIKGKDFYIEYALNIPLGNSDFPELPHTVERAWGENGVEMKPVSEIIITDDFKGKIVSSNKECPHKLSYGNITNPDHKYFPAPKQFSEVKSQLYYSRLTEIDGDMESYICNKNGYVPHQLFSFNLIEMVERKLGCEIPSSDKVQWVRTNILNYTCTAYGKGQHPSGYKYTINNYCPAETRWFNDHRTHTSSSISEVVYAQPENWVYKSIDDDGFIHFLIYTGASSSSFQSAISTDYIKLLIRLKTDSTYTTLYCENTRAREDKCNPVLVQKETKTVKRYLPSKECFTTECKYVDMKRTKLNTDRELLTKLYENGKIYSTTQGSGSYLPHTASRYKNITNILKLEAIYPYTFYNESLYRSPLLNLMTFSNQLTDTNINNGTNTKFMPIECYDIPRYLVFKPYISIHDNEIRLYIYSSLLTKNTTSTQYTHSGSLQALHVYDIPNRPLIK